MRFARYQQNGHEGLAAADNGGALHGFLAGQRGYPGDLGTLIAAGHAALATAASRLLEGPEIALEAGGAAAAAAGARQDSLRRIELHRTLPRIRF